MNVADKETINIIISLQLKLICFNVEMIKPWQIYMNNEYSPILANPELQGQYFIKRMEIDIDNNMCPVLTNGHNPNIIGWAE